MKKIIGNTVGMGLPKPNLMQNDPNKGDFVKGREEFKKEFSGAVPVPESAIVGQFIVVSAVDENGKVTATEAITLPDAEGVAF